MDEGTGAAQSVMLRLPKFTPRMMLILAHDLLAAVAAVVAAFYIRFEGAGLAARLPLFPLYPHAAARPPRRARADDRHGAGRRCRGAAARQRERCFPEIAGGRHPVAVARRSRPVDPRRSGG